MGFYATHQSNYDPKHTNLKKKLGLERWFNKHCHTNNDDRTSQIWYCGPEIPMLLQSYERQRKRLPETCKSDSLTRMEAQQRDPA